MNINEFLSLVGESLQVVQTNFSLLGILAIQILGVGSFFYLWQSKNRISTRLSFEIIFSVGISSLVIGEYLIILASKYLATLLLPLSIGLLAFSLSSITFFIFKLSHPLTKKKITGKTIAIIILATLIAIIRFSFMYKLDVPLYYDSSVHYQIIKDFLSPNQSPEAFYNLGKILSLHYYHFGFHGIVAASSAISGQNILQTILVIGQVFLIIAPFSVALFVKRLTLDTWSGIYAGVFAGLGWSMPAYAVNWGKYPAIAAIAIIPLVLIWLTFLVTSKKHKKGFLLSLFCLTLISTSLLHTRAIIIVASILAALLFLKLIVLVILFRTNHNFYDAVIPYFQNSDLLVSLLAIFFTLFCVVRYGELTFTILASTIIIWGVSFVPVPAPLIKYFGEYFLDRPFIQTFMFVPLSVTAGIGLQSLLAYFVSKLKQKAIIVPTIFPLLVFVVLALFLLFSRPINNYKPDPCCIFVKPDDLFTIGWMVQNLPKDSQILIASEYVTNQNIAVDGGAWIHPLTGIKTMPMSYSTDFTSNEIHSLLCASHITDIYLGSTPTGFDVAGLVSKKSWYQIVISLPETRLYQVNCDLFSVNTGR